MDGYVSKPIQLEQLTRVMEEVLAGDKGLVSPAPKLAHSRGRKPGRGSSG